MDGPEECIRLCLANDGDERIAARGWQHSFQLDEKGPDAEDEQLTPGMGRSR
jgi:hypothetical protein